MNILCEADVNDNLGLADRSVLNLKRQTIPLRRPCSPSDDRLPYG